MANIKSAKKRILVNRSKAAQNKAFKTALKTSIKKFETAVAEGNKDAAKAAYVNAVAMTDKAVAKGIMHKNKAASKKSQFTTAVAKMA